MCCELHRRNQSRQRRASRFAYVERSSASGPRRGPLLMERAQTSTRGTATHRRFLTTWSIPTRSSQEELRSSCAGTRTGSHLGLPDEDESQLAVIWRAEVTSGLLTLWQIIEDTPARRQQRLAPRSGPCPCQSSPPAAVGPSRGLVLGGGHQHRQRALRHRLRKRTGLTTRLRPAPPARQRKPTHPGRQDQSRTSPANQSGPETKRQGRGRPKGRDLRTRPVERTAMPGGPRPDPAAPAA